MDHPAFPEHADPTYVVGGVSRFLEKRAAEVAAALAAEEAAAAALVDPEKDRRSGSRMLRRPKAAR